MTLLLTEGAIAEAIAHRYVDELFRNDPLIDTLLLGCTHFPVLAAALRAVIGPSVTIVDSAETTAQAVHTELLDRGLLREAGPPMPPILQATDSPERFARVGSRFLGEAFDAGRVELVDISPTR